MDKEDVVHICNGILLIVIKQNEILSFATTWMDLEMKKKKRETLIVHSCNSRNKEEITVSV